MAIKKIKQAEADPLANVDYVLPVVVESEKQWRVVRDCIDGQDAIKARSTTYLPQPNPADKSIANVARYDNYKTRGLFINFTARTLNGMVGTAFSKAPIATLPEMLDIMHEDVDGGSVTMDQQAKQVLSDALSVGRCGLLTDYPTAATDEEGKPINATRAQINAGEVRPVIQFYFAEDIINWKYTTVHAKRKLSLLVLRETYTIDVDEFMHEVGDQWRILRLRDGVATVEVVQDTADGRIVFAAETPILQSNRQPFDYIPFEFVGARNNDGGVDEVPMKAIADINIGHYRNSCDFEEMVFVLGQPTTVIAGLTEKWVTNVLGGEVIVGSTSAIMLPAGATADYLQVNESQIALVAMEHKEKVLVAIGAKMVSTATVQRTAKEAGMEDASEQSVLLAAVNNVNSAYKRSLASACLFSGAPYSDDVGYEMNTDFEIMQLDHAAITARVKMWADGIISFTEVRSILRRAGIATEEDNKAKAEIEADTKANMEAMGEGTDEFGKPLGDEE